MASSGNFCTLNPLTQPNSGTFSEGNLLFTHTTSDWRTTAGTHGMRTGKWYWEAHQYENLAGNGFPIGISDIDNGTFVTTQASSYPAGSDVRGGPAYSAYTNSGSYASKYYNGSESLMTLSIGASGDVWQCALDLDNGKIWFGKNNTWDNSGNPATGSNPSYSGGQLSDSTTRTWVPITCSYNDSNSENYPQNFGQDSTFAGRITAGGNADENGFGDFKYAPPTGFLALCSGNLPVSDDIDPAQTDDDFPQKQFNAITYTGNASTQAITGVGFKPDLFWFHRRDYSGSYNTGIIDSSRGVGLGLYPDRTNADTSFTSDFNSFDTDGVTLKAGSSANINNNSSTFAAWMWRANGGTTSSNSDGDITSTVQANTNAGFSIVTYTGDNTDHRGVGYGSANIGHGLNKAPEFIITKRRDSTGSWYTYHAGAGIGYLLLESSAVFQSGAVPFGPNAPTTTTFGGYSANNNSSHTYVCYCWHSVDGYSKFGSYTGNGNANGPFIYTGFRPRMIFVKRSSTTGGWWVFDSARDTHNPVDRYLGWHDSSSEGTNSNFDFLSNGFKLRTSDGDFNGSGNTIIYGAWGDVPFRYNNSF